MNYKLIKCSITNNIDRIRGADEIAVTVNCKFLNEKGSECEMVGVALAKTPTELTNTVATAIDNAKQNLLLLDTETAKQPNQNLTKIMKDMIGPATNVEVRKITHRPDLDKMYETVSDDKQQKITGLCEALGIDIIDVVGNKWTNVEVLVLSNYLERMTEPLTMIEGKM